MRGDAQARLAHIPDAAGLARVGEEPHVGRGRGAIESFHQVACLGFGFGDSVGAELDHQPSAAFGEQSEAFEVDAFAAAGVDDDVVKAFEADGSVLHDLRNVVGADDKCRAIR